MFTASLSKYANPLYAQLDHQKSTSYSLFREHCTFWNGIFVKDLTRLGRNMSDVIIVDNSPAAYLFQPENALPCQSWYEDKKDDELKFIIPLLKKLASVGDVRDHMKHFVSDAKIDFGKAEKYFFEEQRQPEILMTPPPHNVQRRLLLEPESEEISKNLF